MKGGDAGSDMGGEGGEVDLTVFLIISGSSVCFIFLILTLIGCIYHFKCKTRSSQHNRLQSGQDDSLSVNQVKKPLKVTKKQGNQN